MTGEDVTRVGVIGAYGRMGSTACRAIEAAEDLELAARVGSGDDLAGLLDGVDVALDLTRPAAVEATLAACVARGVSVVVGTSGVAGERLARVRTIVDAAPGTSVLVVPNFSIGAVLLTRFAAAAAPFYESVEVVELHHPDKVDAPSGTARRTAELIAAARAAEGLPERAPDATSDELPGARGTRVAGIPVHAVRLRGMVASEEVLLGAPGEALTLRHDSFDRESFMPGVLLALRRVRDLPGLTVGLEAHLDLP